MKIFFATDIHGSEVCWRKFLNSAAFYKADLTEGIPPEVGTGFDLVLMADVLEHRAKMVASIRFLPEPPPTYNPTFFACGVKSLWVELHPAEPC